MTKQAERGDVATRLLRPTLILLLGLAAIAAICLASAGVPFITLHLFRTQDLPAVVALAGFSLLVPRLLKSPGWVARFAALADASLSIPPWVLAALVAVVGLVGGWLVFGFFPLSMDEFWARADGAIYATGQPMARIPAEWRDYAAALQPMFTRIIPQEGLWASEYLPLNAVIQHNLGPLAGPLLAGFSILVAADIARRLLPEHRSAPIVCAVLMASSSQLLLNAMTPYAMSAHLAVNLSWLWLFLHSSRLAQFVALPLVGLAIGLHQVVFFPLFALPFLFEAFLTGRRGAAILQGAAIALAFLFWSGWDALLYWWFDVVPAKAGPTGTALLFKRAVDLVAGFDASNLGLMSLNLIRWTVWQNLLAVPLLLTVAWTLVRKAGAWRAMLAGIVLTGITMTVVLAFQGHGWGYRYLHGLLGSLCLLATLAWFRIVERTDDRRRMQALFGAALVLSLALLPFRAWQAERFTTPYRTADAAISRIDADVVVVNAPGHAYSIDLVRNDPFLINRPKRMTPVLLTDQQLAEICRKYQVVEFGDADAERFGIASLSVVGETERQLPEAC
ncbi:hypothetical protein [Altererythrobacter sp. Root672]|uniref:hypothetical protein n=1 Tax=Altererythrobacter sp. Root672 TaxID=1736584 RepID=UPI0012E3F5C6|nr:hypothetical protein [Altererythrobacter sp. Root672]